MNRNSSILILGDSGVGKTTFIKRHLTGDFTKSHNSYDFKIHELPFKMCVAGYKQTKFMHTLHLYDYPADKLPVDKSPSLRWVKRPDSVVIMFDVTNATSYANVSKWIKKVTDAYGKIDIILCGNKVDCKNRVVKPADITVTPGHAYFDVSAKSNYNFEKPFLNAIRRFYRLVDLMFYEDLAVSEEIERCPICGNGVASPLCVCVFPSLTLIEKKDDTKAEGHNNEYCLACGSYACDHVKFSKCDNTESSPKKERCVVCDSQKILEKVAKCPHCGGNCVNPHHEPVQYDSDSSIDSEELDWAQNMARIMEGR
jgi:GTP-binding nuclear protein Ran